MKLKIYLILLDFNKYLLLYEYKTSNCKSKNLRKVLLLLGFEKKRQKGSHVFYRHKDGDILHILIMAIKKSGAH